ncbi:MAG: alcohol dehydrogenase catalytic domain-containing protein [bacterium]|nr:alcohol dehydrogenase catalytic domain-containing protein [bacterium]
MSTTTEAAVLRTVGEPLSIEAIEIHPPAHGEVILEMGAAGICGSDRYVIEGAYPVEPPAVCGHEGAGVVVEVGPGVQSLDVGDSVVQIFKGPCGTCRNCRRGLKTFCPTGMDGSGRLRDGTYRMFDQSGSAVGTHLGLGSFARHTVTPERHLVKIPDGVEPAVAALVSCGVSTGVGAAVNVADVQPGDSVMVLGIGGVGAAAVMGAALAGAERVVAVDVKADKLALAPGYGATDVVDASAADVAEAVGELTDGWGVDAVLLTPDRVRPEHYETAIACLSAGGMVVQVGGTSHGMESIPISPNLLLAQRAIVGTTIGGPDPARDVVRWIDLYRAGRLPLEKLITQRYQLEEINTGFADLAAGRNIRGVIAMSGV